ncbi:sirohydrochlorin chelatase [Nonomuraea ferruginea]|uniref:Sirohydrochlorin chelatase n=1 Tax=Nonomuraea ferruginea TaxID=46174 RepID=A0ABT4TCP4_9ACTN|nr:CbiX/SirB N-terminal domain-containing protein [Nonomuraea ferruginea]MDA0646910.1 sirohydrochlorin chelatase [Nonomuraea ferruginea]
MAVAHGSRDPRAAATVEALLDEVRRLRPWLPVRSAYLDHATPTLGQALHGLTDAVVLPLLLTEAYHSRVDLPAALREARAREPRLRVRYGTTLGPHPLLTAALERRLEEAGVPAGDPDTAVVLVSAGSSDARANEVIARLARAWRRPAAAPSFAARSFAARPGTTPCAAGSPETGWEPAQSRATSSGATRSRTAGSGAAQSRAAGSGAARSHAAGLEAAQSRAAGSGAAWSEVVPSHAGRFDGGSVWAATGAGCGWWAVEAAYASAAAPTPAKAVARLKEAGAPRVAVAPYLLAPGYFADKVRRTTLEAGADVVADVLGPAPELARVLLERYESALRSPAGDLRTA